MLIDEVDVGARVELDNLVVGNASCLDSLNANSLNQWFRICRWHRIPLLIEDSKKVNIVRDNSVSSGIIKTNDSPFTKGMLARFFTHKPTHCEGLWTQIACRLLH